MAKLFDTKCFDLAEAFLEDHPHLNTEANRDQLAAEIQSAIEDEIHYMQSNYEPRDSSATTGGTADDLRQQQIEAMKLK